MAITSTTVINTRSPYFIKVNTTYSAQLKLYAVAGASSLIPSSLRYTIEKIVAGSNTFVVYEISQLIRDYFTKTWDSDNEEGLHVRLDIQTKASAGGSYGAVTTTYYIAFDGYGYHEEGVNPRTTPNQSLMQDNNVHYFLSGEDIRIPVFSDLTSFTATIPYTDYDYSVPTDLPAWTDNNYYSDTTGAVDFLDIPPANTQLSISSSTNSNEKLRYIYITNTDRIYDNATITLEYSTGGSTATEDIVLKETRCNKFEKIKLVFYNKYGAMQELWVQNKSTKNLNVERETYNGANMDLSTLTYDIYEHAKKTHNINSSERITVNTDVLDDDYNDVVKQLMMSDAVWIDEAGSVYPVNVITSEMRVLTVVNDKMVKYTFELEYAFNKINDII